MNEVLDNDFREIYLKLENSLKSAAFIAIDAEFSGIEDATVSKLTLFDNAEERYDKQRRNIKAYTAVQIGLTAFKKIKHENKYIAEPFKFYLLSRSLPDDDNQDLRWQKQTLKFLQSHSFDFNKWVYSGIPYMNELETVKMTIGLKTDSFMNDGLIFSNSAEENDFMRFIVDVKKWLKLSKPEEKSMKIECRDFFQCCCLQNQLRKAFKSIWTECNDNVITVIKIDPETRTVLEEEAGNLLEEQLVDYCRGFTKVFKLLCDLKKPIVGHNILLDLMFMYKQFYRDLPRSYDKFKKEIHELLPEIYDTKFIAYELRSVLEKSLKAQGKKKPRLVMPTILGELYSYLKSGKGGFLPANSVEIELFDGSAVNDESYHDAGWDSYYTGYSFIKMANCFAIQQRGGSMDALEITSNELMLSIKEFANKVNLLRASLSHIKFDGADPVSTRPAWISIKTIDARPINIAEIVTAISSFDTCDVRKYSSRSVLVATPNFKTARDIFKYFHKSEDFKADSFSIVKHSSTMKALLWGTVVLSGGLLAAWIHRMV